ncbi:MAG: aminoacyl-tRNA hydrolase [Betaproteobacteria bacterium]|nr:MAG: aminoacyl-tRNA hydrolase [Betaproteobacteria bacterium]
MKLVAGLGNPGRKYTATRHNAGFWWVERLAEITRTELRTEARFQGRVGRLVPPHGSAWLLLPETFMNHSGRAVAALASFYRIAPEEILVVHDELDLPPGTAKLKKGGGAGGHNGVTDVAAQLGTKEFWRLRIGIGHPGVRDEVIDYVLCSPRHEERTAIWESIERSLELWSLVAQRDMESAMQKLHTKGPSA